MHNTWYKTAVQICFTILSLHWVSKLNKSCVFFVEQDFHAQHDAINT